MRERVTREKAALTKGSSGPKVRSMVSVTIRVPLSIPFFCAGVKFCGRAIEEKCRESQECRNNSSE
jgi:hypothetical protein